MKTAALYDIHGNLPALKAVLCDVEQAGVEQIIIGGDLLVGPMSRECLEAMHQCALPTKYILGNCEVAVLDVLAGNDLGPMPESAIEDITWTAEQISIEYQKHIASWPKTIDLDLPGLGRVLFCHATPRDENEIFTKETKEEVLVPIFDGLQAGTIICGHTHMQFDRKIGSKRVVNAGSVGMPFGRQGAGWLLLDQQIQLQWTAYDLDEASRQIKNTNYPHANDFAEKNVLNPPSEEVMLKALKNAEVKS